MKTSGCICKIALLSIFFAASTAFAVAASADDDLRLRTVVIDAGHGGHDPGCVSRDGRVKEKDINLDIALKLGSGIASACPDVKVIYTRKTDVFVPLNTRADIANRNNANLFISIHVNAATSTQAHGFSTHILGNNNDRFSDNMDVVRRENSVILLEEDYTTTYQGFDPNDPESFIFFNLMQNAYYEQSLTYAAEADKQLKKGPVTHSRGISQNAFLVLWKTTMPAVLVETGFMSNAADIKILNSSEGRSEIARRLCDAFKAFKVKYDASLDYAAEPSAAESSSVRKPDDSPAETPAAVRDGYGVQIFALSKKLPAGDASLKGYEADAVKAGSMYKYIIRCNTADEARKLFRKTRKEFPGSFPVQIRSGEVSALK